MNLSNPDRADLKRAKQLLENPGFAAKMTSALGAPIEKAFTLLPARWSKSVHKASEAALLKALDLAVKSLSDKPTFWSGRRIHTIAAAVSGGAGGAFGLPALAIELPISTAIMLRSIADIAKGEGENIQSIDAKLECLTVFALGGDAKNDDASESGYFAVRGALATAVSEASKFLAQKGLGKAGAPPIVRLISTLAARFGVVVSEKAAAQAIPIVGAASGALVNTIFIGHFQDMARGHFIVRRLERNYGAETVRKAYEHM